MCQENLLINPSNFHKLVPSFISSIYVRHEISPLVPYDSEQIFRKFMLKDKLDGVGPVDNRPSTDKLHHFLKKEKKKKNVTCDT